MRLVIPLGYENGERYFTAIVLPTIWGGVWTLWKDMSERYDVRETIFSQRARLCLCVLLVPPVLSPSACLPVLLFATQNGNFQKKKHGRLYVAFFIVITKYPRKAT